MPPNGRILEIACGTGQATLPFAECGYAMVGLDIGPSLAAIARQNCRQYPKVEIYTISFEDWDPEANRFDLAISATAFHWIQPEVGYPKVAQVLRDSGYAAIFANLHPTPYTGFFQEVQGVYERVVPEWSSLEDKPSTDEKIDATVNQINQSGLFEPVLVQRYPWSRVYSREQYLRLLNTYSDHRNLDEERKRRLFGGIGQMIDDWGGQIVRPYLSVLYLARKGATG